MLQGHHNGGRVEGRDEWCKVEDERRVARQAEARPFEKSDYIFAMSSTIQQLIFKNILFLPLARGSSCSIKIRELYLWNYICLSEVSIWKLSHEFDRVLSFTVALARAFYFKKRTNLINYHNNETHQNYYMYNQCRQIKYSLHSMMLPLFLNKSISRFILTQFF
jgi:hypothetical protein